MTEDNIAVSIWIRIRIWIMAIISFRVWVRVEVTARACVYLSSVSISHIAVFII